MHFCLLHCLEDLKNVDGSKTLLAGAELWMQLPRSGFMQSARGGGS